MTSDVLEVMRFARIDARLAPFDWPFRRAHAGEIAANWTRLSADKPAVFNGQVLLQSRSWLDGATFHADYFQTDYASFVGWHHLGCPSEPGFRIRNGFAMSALRARDGAFLMGVMGPHTVNAGKIYFAAGTPDPSDLDAEGRLDLAGSALRELLEETGLTEDEVEVREGWTAVAHAARIAFMRDVRIDLPAGEARRLMLARMARQAEPELSDIAVAHGPGDIDEARMPPFMQHFLRTAFAEKVPT